MPFDPDAFVGASRPAAPAFDPDAFIGKQPSLPAAEGPGVIESGLRGLKQGVTLGFGDELTGAIESLFTAKTYKQARDEARANDKAAEASHPWVFGGGELAGGVATSLVPGLGIAKGAGLAANALKAGAISAVQGLGSSDKETLGGQLQDAATSGVLGGVTAGVAGKVLSGAPERLEKRLLGNITEGATATQRDRVVGKAGSRVGDVLEAIKGDKAIKAAGAEPSKLLPAIQESLDATGARLDAAVAKGAPIKVSDVMGRIEDVATELEKDPGKRALANAVRGKANDVLETWGNQTHVTPQQVRTLASDVGNGAFTGSPAVEPKAGAATARKVWGELKDLLKESVEQGGGDAKEMAAVSKKMSTLISMRDAVTYRATRESTPSTTLTSRLGGALDLGLAFADPTSFVAKKSYDFVGKPVARAADAQLAQLVMAARNGSTSAQLGQMALQMGFGSGVGTMLGQWAANKFGGAGATGAPPPPGP